MDYEKLGAFYLGRGYDPEDQSDREDLLLYDARDLTTHALVVGMTGSGKTGLSIVLLEEAAVDGIPALIIDPKGDMGNLLLSFPRLLPEDFRPWIDENEAVREGLTPDEYSARTAAAWREGLRKWGQSEERIARFRNAADLAIYTPGSDSGLPVNLMRSFAAPPAALARDPDALRERTVTAVSSLLGLVGIEADPIRSREHVLISSILSRSWDEARDMDLAALIGEIQTPRFDKLGVMDLESFYPSRDRFELAMQLNNLIASEAFSAWTKGDVLDIQRLLYTGEGRPRLAILSIAHLSDAEKMFFVTLLLNEVVSWMRTLPGTGSLRALLYMDEIFGFFPPTASPPSKLPMLTLLKQARAYGLGVVLATQNPVDLDYKGLANTGTWFLGRLQTARDKERVMEGLEGSSAGRGFQRQELDHLLSSLGKRAFLMHNVHEDNPVVFQTRWAMSYLRGPLTRDQIGILMQARKVNRVERPREAPPPPDAQTAAKPGLPTDIKEVFLPASRPVSPSEAILYRPALLGNARLHFVSSRHQIDQWEEISWLVPFSGSETDVMDIDWDAGTVWQGEPKGIDNGAAPRARFAELPAVAMRSKSYETWSKSFAAYLYQSRALTVWKCPELRETSRPEETEADFRIRVSQLLREQRDRDVEKLREDFAPKLSRLRERIAEAEERLARETSQYDHQKMQTAISIGATVLGALFGRKLGSSTTVGRATTSARSASRAARERQDIRNAEGKVERLRDKLASLEQDFEEVAAVSRIVPNPSELKLEPISLRPRKSDITIRQMALAWTA